MNLFELQAKIALDVEEYTKGLNAAEKDTKSTAKNIDGAFSKMGKGLAAGAGIVAAGFAAAASGVAALTTAALKNYANYEQLVGGVETLFKGNASDVQAFAQNAYKTAGLSANQYMETVTSFSASLLQSLGGDTAKAAAYADLAVTDMSDNANKMGTSMESIQMAYQGFAKQNYTMLDNLKLGYGGTKTEMERLIADANAMNAAQGKFTNYTVDSYADVVSAIHDVQTQMGITGTTAKEASTTITGSLSAAKSAWDNLLTAVADDNADMGASITAMVDSATTVASNILPRVQIALQGAAQMVGQLLPVIMQEVPAIISSVLPEIATAAIGVMQALVSGISDNSSQLIGAIVQTANTVVQGLLGMLPQILDAGMRIIAELAVGIAQALPTLIPAAVQAVIGLAQALIGNLPMILDAALQLMMGFVQGILEAIPQIIAALPKLIQSIISFITSSIPMITNAAIQLFMSIIQAIPVIVQSLIGALPQIINSIIDGLLTALPLILEAAISLLMAIIEAIPTIISFLVSEVPTIVSTIINALLSRLPDLINGAISLFMGILQAIPQIIAQLVQQMPLIIASIVQGLADGLAQIIEVGENLVKGLWQGIKNMTGWLWSQVTSWANGLLSWIQGLFGVHSPSTITEWMGEMLMKGLALGIGNTADEVFAAMKDVYAGMFGLGAGQTFNASVAAAITSGTGIVGENVSGGLYSIFGFLTEGIEGLSYLGGLDGLVTEPGDPKPPAPPTNPQKPGAFEQLSDKINRILLQQQSQHRQDNILLLQDKMAGSTRNLNRSLSGTQLYSQVVAEVR